MSTPSYKEKIQKLQSLTEEGERKIKTKETAIPMSVMIGAAVPFIILIILYVLQPKFVTKKEGDKQVRDGTKIFYWTLGLTIVIWGAMYGWVYYNDKK